jgi:hypothetical protein
MSIIHEEDGRDQVAPCGSPLTVVADGAGVIESVCGAGHRYTTWPASSRTAPAGRPSASARTLVSRTISSACCGNVRRMTPMAPFQMNFGALGGGQRSDRSAQRES